ncbi:transposase [Sinosporangium siamense]|uniref:Tc1-like transposase DDE domain-containing protein n=1 Tax=Sinosporangium siamense TaxID=1367973 RepID=A0A919RGY9_9ACTN|nr:transposase [Sinosporangium siamense]GII93696.1 hypothetical protein Ssi02_39270 [Sinosporangium siamense]
MDEKSQIQTLDCSQPVLPMIPGMPERRTHDYVRNGITSLFAAFNVVGGTVIGDLYCRAAEIRTLLIAIDKTVPADLDIRLICDDYGTHKTPAAKARLSRHPRFRVHFTPTRSSWINQVERGSASCVLHKHLARERGRDLSDPCGLDHVGPRWGLVVSSGVTDWNAVKWNMPVAATSLAGSPPMGGTLEQLVCAWPVRVCVPSGTKQRVSATFAYRRTRLQVWRTSRVARVAQVEPSPAWVRGPVEPSNPAWPWRLVRRADEGDGLQGRCSR